MTARDVELLGEGVLSDLPGERRCACVFSFKGAALVSGNTSGLHILTNSLLDLPVDPLLELLLVFWYPPLLLWLYMLVAAARVFFSVDPDHASYYRGRASGPARGPEEPGCAWVEDPRHGYAPEVGSEPFSSPGAAV